VSYYLDQKIIISVAIVGVKMFEIIILSIALLASNVLAIAFIKGANR